MIPGEFELIQFKVDDKNKPYTDNDIEHNMKPREVYCEQCQYRTISSLPAARCGNCFGWLYTVIHRVLDINELAD